MNTLEMVLDLAFLRFSKNRREVKEKELEMVLKKLEDESEIVERNEEDAKEKEYLEELKRSGACVKKAGWITKLLPTYGMIDDRYRFEINLTEEFTNLAEGCRVSYLAYKQKDGIIKVVKIEMVLQEAWDCNGVRSNEKSLDQAIEEYFGTHLRKVNGTVKSVAATQTSSIVTIETEVDREVSVDISTIEIQFNPAVGDKIVLTCKVQTDDTFLDFSGAVLDFVAINPVRTMIDVGTVTRVNPSGDGGRINRNIAFRKAALEAEYVPYQGDIVAFDAIENEKDDCLWRCLKVVLTKRSELPHDEPDQPHETMINERGIVVEEIPPIFLPDIGQKVNLDIVIRNTSNRTHKLFRTIIPVARKMSQLELLSPHIDDSFNLEPGAQQTFKLLVHGRFCGLSAEQIVWKFGGGWQVKRRIEIQVGNDDTIVTVEPPRNPKSRYNSNGYDRQFARKDADVVRGGALMKSTGIISKVIGQFLVPDNMKKLVLGANTKIDAEDSVVRNYPALRHQLEPKNYSHNFHNLLFLEEIQLWSDFRVYDRTEVFFKRPNRDYLSLDIDNVAETRPSLILGDIIRVISPWNDRRVYEGHVHKIQQNRVLVKFEKNFQNSYNGELYNVQFQYTRGNFRKLHHAVGKILDQMEHSVIFPTRVEPKPPQVDVEIVNGEMLDQKSGKVLKWFNGMLNEAQKRAIKNVLRGEARPMPYIIFGPPGTGKTYTVLEAILQIATNVPHSRILVCASSNSAANLITERLISCRYFFQGDFIRIVGLSAIDRNSIPEHLHPYCALCDISIDGTTSNEIKESETGLKMHCNSKYLAEKKVIIGTCQALGSFMTLNLRNKNHFTHAIIDEAGQCSEPESVIPLTLLHPDMGQIILAGDPRQLGPQILSPIAKNHGLGVSLLDRLLERFPYEKNYDRHAYGFDERLVTKLIYNYRSIPSVLKLYSDLFYDEKLVPTILEEGSEEIAFLEKYKSILPDTVSPKHGVFFFSVIGENRQDIDSPSWYNPVEAKNIFIFCTKLYKLGIKHSDIGIITPYKAQVQRIRQFMHQIDEDKIPKVGSVEEFQGQERNIIILSTVRSSKSFLTQDFKHSMGFVQNNKRLNVAISRAKSLLIIFGNANLLATDPNWCKVIRYAADQSAFFGDLPLQLGSQTY